MSISGQMAGPPILRLGHVFAFAAYLKRIGAPAERHLRRQGIPLYSEDPNEFVPVSQAWSFFHASARSEDSMLGWHVGRYVGDHNLNHRLLKRLETAPTLYLALKWLIDLASSEASHVHLGVIERSRDILFFTQYPAMKGRPGYTASQTYQLGLIIDLIRHFLGPAWVPKEIGIEYPEVPKVVEELYPGARLMPRQRFGYLAVPRSSLHVAAPGARPEERVEFSPALMKNIDYAETLATLLHAYLPGGYPPARLAAGLMETSVTTMSRRLTECGTSYRSLIDGVRFKQAKELLQGTDLRITDASLSVGFDDSSNFARMFRRMGGLSPRQFRAVIRH